MSADKKREMLGTTRMSYKFQITIPKEVRERFHLKAQDILVFLDESGNLILRKSTQVIS
jgi:AbrB family looped-hinge helix DNA binding protein